MSNEQSSIPVFYLSKTDGLNDHYRLIDCLSDQLYCKKTNVRKCEMYFLKIYFQNGSASIEILNTILCDVLFSCKYFPLIHSSSNVNP